MSSRNTAGKAPASAGGRDTRIAQRAVASKRSAARLVAFACLFMACSFILVWQRNTVNDLDSRISILQDELADTRSGNDSLEGKLIEAQSIRDVEEYALNVLHMRKPDDAHTERLRYTDPAWGGVAED